MSTQSRDALLASLLLFCCALGLAAAFAIGQELQQCRIERTNAPIEALGMEQKK